MYARVNDQRVTSTLPNLRCMVRTVQRTRKAEAQVINNDNNLETMEIPEDFQKTLGGINFLYHDSDGGNRRFSIYATEENLKTLKNCKLWLADGTFKCVPSILYQMFTIHVLFTMKCDGVVKFMSVPLVYMLLPDKTILEVRIPQHKSYSRVLY